MFIERVQVDEGFLDGLDLRLVPGLNVLIGARGTGKTSIIELIRFALGVGSYTAESGKRSSEHVAAVLDSGQVTVTLRDGDRSIIVTRAIGDVEPRSSSPYATPIVFSQTEIETLALQASGRLRLIDGFVDERNKLLEEEARTEAQVRSISSEIESINKDISSMEGKANELPVLKAALQALAEKEAAVGKSSASAAAMKQQLDVLATQLADIGVAQSFLERFTENLAAWTAPLDQLIQFGVPPDPWQAKGEDPLADLRPDFEAAVGMLSSVRDRFHSLREKSNGEAAARAERRLVLEQEARQIRREIEALETGAGALARESAQLRQRVAQLESLSASLADRQARVHGLQAKRAALLDQLDAIRQERFDRRNAICERIRRKLGPRIGIKVQRAGIYDDYSRVITDALRGSGLRYADIADQIAENVSPRELMEAAEANDFQLLADVVGIAKDRAARILAQLRDRGLGELSTCKVEDDVRLELLDGPDYKDLANLSTGQRCTVVLPVVLEHQEKVLIVDQPEDHIDNAFIADTLIKSIATRSKDTQLIFSTHNANIPVLGEADQVVQMGSDGRRGFVVIANPLDHPAAVDAISNVMEGGRAAFGLRADFYSRHDARDQ